VLALETRGDVRFCEIYGNSPRSAALGIERIREVLQCQETAGVLQALLAKRSNNVRDGTVGEALPPPGGSLPPRQLMALECGVVLPRAERGAG